MYPVRDLKAEKLYAAVKRIPPGRISTYIEASRAAGIKSPRHTGRLLSKNPCIGKIPCHRIVRSDGSVGGYSGEGGKDGKINILRSEGIEFEGDVIKNFSDRFVPLAKTP